MPWFRSSGDAERGDCNRIGDERDGERISGSLVFKAYLRGRQTLELAQKTRGVGEACLKDAELAKIPAKDL
jgi:hypothetical protein